MDVKVKIKTGPVYMKWLNGQGLDNEYLLWNETYGHEYFPQNVEAAGYVLTLRKSMSHSIDVSNVEKKLIDALTMLSEAWTFSGGSPLPLKKKKTGYELLYISNAQEVEKELLAKEGKKKFSFAAFLPISWGCQYSEAPLKKAISICRALKSMQGIHKILSYYAKALLTNNEKWFVDLYKVRESLKECYGNKEKRTKKALKISDEDWRFFGTKLNAHDHDLRHHLKGVALPIPIDNDDKIRMESLAREWIMACLKKENIIH